MELTVIKPGKPLDDPEKNVRYFICDVCECEFKADKRDCRARHVSLPDLTTTYYTCSCPNCKAICFGHIKSEYTRRKRVQLKEQEEKQIGRPFRKGVKDMNIHEVIGIWESIDPTLKMMQAADKWCLYDEEPFYILTRVASVCSFDTFMEFWRDVICVHVTPNFICYIWDMCGKKPDEFLAWVSDLYDNYAIIEPFGGA